MPASRLACLGRSRSTAKAARPAPPPWACLIPGLSRWYWPRAGRRLAAFRSLCGPPRLRRALPVVASGCLLLLLLLLRQWRAPSVRCAPCRLEKLLGRCSWLNPSAATGDFTWGAEIIVCFWMVICGEVVVICVVKRGGLMVLISGRKTCHVFEVYFL